MLLQGAMITGDRGRAVLLDDLHEAESGGLYCEKCYP